MQKLGRSLLLQDHFPYAFANGPCTTFVVGNPHYPGELMFVVRDGVGERLSKPALEIPIELWETSARTILETTPRLHYKTKATYRRLLDGLQPHQA